AGAPAFDIRNQCSGFIYGLQMADAFLKTGAYRHILLIGAEVHSTGLDFTDRGRDVAVLFGDGAAAVVLGCADNSSHGLLCTHVHADGRFAEALQIASPSSAVMPRISEADLIEGKHYPQMEGRLVFKHAVQRMPEVVMEALHAEGLTTQDIDLLIPHQANLRISEMVQRRLELPDDKVFNNIQRFGNTTACSIPLALSDALQQGKLKSGDLLCLAAFGAGFTWGAALIRW
ncbi:MAG: beta-ketoacyl-ACP synthase 3, partial [Myxococcota bacterium]